jgi:hypothetical protein
MTTDLADLAAALQIGLGAPGLCIACLTFPAFAEGEREIAREVRNIAPVLWAEGFGRPVRAALRSAVDDGVAGAEPALRDLDERTFRSAIFRAVVHRLAAELRTQSRRRYLASLN